MTSTSSGGLIDIAYNILEKELTQRGMSIPPRTEELEEAKDSTQSLRAYWEGRASLASAVGLLSIIGGFVIGLVIGLVNSFAETQGCQRQDRHGNRHARLGRSHHVRSAGSNRHAERT